MKVFRYCDNSSEQIWKCICSKAKEFNILAFLSFCKQKNILSFAEYYSTYLQLIWLFFHNFVVLARKWPGEIKMEADYLPTLMNFFRRNMGVHCISSYFLVLTVLESCKKKLQKLSSILDYAKCPLSTTGVIIIPTFMFYTPRQKDLKNQRFKKVQNSKSFIFEKS